MKRNIFAIYGLTVSGGVFAASNANAQLSSLLNNAATESGDGPGLVLSVVSYIIGVGLVLWGIFRFKEFADGKASIADAAWRVGGGACMVALPWFTGAVINTIFGTPGDGAEGQYTGLTAGSCAASGGGLDQCMMSLVNDIYYPFQLLINVVCYTAGAICVGVGVYRLAQMGQAGVGRAPKVSGTVGYIGGGTMLISLGQLMKTVTTSIFGSDEATTVFTTLSYTGSATLPGGLAKDANGVYMALFAWVQLIGYLAFARGVFLLIKLAQGEGKSHGQAFTHLIAGALAVNMYPLIEAVQTTLGVSWVT